MSGLAGAAERWAAERPDAVAVADARGTWTWAELAAVARAVATSIRAAAAGAVPAGTAGGLVAMDVTASALGVAAIHGAAMSGARVVLVPARWSPHEVGGLLGAVRPSLVLDAREPHESPRWAGRREDLRRLSAHALGGRLAVPQPSGGPAGSPVAGELVVPTSGTTARPRLARLPLDRIDASATAWAAVLPRATAWLLSLGLGHVAGLGIVARAAAEGVPVVVPGEGDDLGELLGARGGHGTAAHPPISHASLVATQLARLLDATRDEPPAPTLRAVLLGGGPIPPALVSRATAAGWPVWPSYGATETASGVAAADPAQARAHPSSAGTALPGVELRIAHASASAVGPALGDPGPDAPGELEVRGPMVFAGYLDDAPATAARLGPTGWLRTGDLATMDRAGRLHVLDRIDDLIISGGENVAPAEIEAVLATLPGVREAAVVGVPDATWGSVPVAIVVPVGGADPRDAELLAAAGERLAGFRRPRRVVRMAQLPRGGADKVLRRTLRETLASGVGHDPARGAALDPGSEDPAFEQRWLLADDGQVLSVRAAPRRTGDALPAVLLLHATLSGSAQLLRLAAALAPDARAILLDRRGSAASPMGTPAPVPVARHVADAAQALAAVGEADAILVGHSFGGVVALSLAAARPDVVRAVIAWEPPWIPLAPPADRTRLAGVAARVEEAHRSGGPAAAARSFMDVVSPGAWERLRGSAQDALAASGDGVLADAAMSGLDTDALSRIAAPVVIGTGAASEAAYAPIAMALVRRIPGARVESLAGQRHAAPIVAPTAIAQLVRPLLGPVLAPAAQEPTR